MIVEPTILFRGIIVFQGQFLSAGEAVTGPGLQVLTVGPPRDSRGPRSHRDLYFSSVTLSNLGFPLMPKLIKYNYVLYHKKIN